ncbi:MAG: FMN-binding protein [Candidatus Weimeria sp.]
MWPDFFNELKKLIITIPCIVVAVCVAVSLSSYKPPVVKSDTEASSSGNATGRNTSSITTSSDAGRQTTASSGETETATVQAGGNGTETVNIASVKTPEGLKDGTYTGTGQGFGGTTTLSVTVKNGRIKSISVLSHNDTPAFFKKASALLSEIVSKNGTSGIDAVSGATYSSRGIIEAVNSALKKADVSADGSSSARTASSKKKTSISKNSDKKTKDQASKKSTSDSSSDEDTDKDNPDTGTSDNDSSQGTEYRYTDGTYSLSGNVEPDEFEAFDPYTITLDLIIKDGRISDLTNVKGSGDGYINNDADFIRRALEGTSKKPGLIEQLKTRNTTDGVDTVSGATWSSKAIISMVKKALSGAASGE